jgi:hypothetical protein
MTEILTSRKLVSCIAVLLCALAMLIGGLASPDVAPANSQSSRSLCAATNYCWIVKSEFSCRSGTLWRRDLYRCNDGYLRWTAWYNTRIDC